MKRLFLVVVLLASCRTVGESTSLTKADANDSETVSSICSGIIVPQLQTQCFQTIKDRRFHTGVMTVCSPIIVPQLAIECLGASANKTYSADEISQCFSKFIPQDKVSCMDANGTPDQSGSSNDYTSYCADIIVTAIRQQCLQIVQSGTVPANAGALCKTIIIPQIRIQCLSTIMDKTYADSAIAACQSIVPQEIVACLGQ